MRKEARLLKGKAISSLLLSIDHFNSILDTGRVEAVLILLDHSFEMLLKAGILAKGGKIRERADTNTIGFDACVRRALSNDDVRFLTEDQALTLQTINGLRDAAQHHLLELSEGQLYLHAQSGITLFRDLLLDLFQQDLSELLPERVLPVSTVAPLDPLVMFATELDEVRRLLAPGKRRRAEAEAKLRGLAIVDHAIQGSLVQPGEAELHELGRQVAAGKSLADVFPGIGSVQFESDGVGPRVNLRISKAEGVPVTIVPEGTPGAGVVALKRVDEMGFYNLSHKNLEEKLGLGQYSVTAARLGAQGRPRVLETLQVGGGQGPALLTESVKSDQSSLRAEGRRASEGGVSRDSQEPMTPMDRSLRSGAYENEQWWDRPRHYYVGKPWFVQVLDNDIEVGGAELDDPGGINPLYAKVPLGAERLEIQFIEVATAARGRGIGTQVVRALTERHGSAACSRTARRRTGFGPHSAGSGSTTPRVSSSTGLYSSSGCGRQPPVLEALVVHVGSVETHGAGRLLRRDRDDQSVD
jgi:hypothetical protein